MSCRLNTSVSLTIGKASARLWHLAFRQVKVGEIKPPFYLQQLLKLCPPSFGGEHSISGSFSEGINQRAETAPLPQTERSPVPWEVPPRRVPVFRE